VPAERHFYRKRRDPSPAKVSARAGTNHAMGVFLALAAAPLVGMQIGLVVTLVVCGYIYAILIALRRRDGAAS